MEGATNKLQHKLLGLSSIMAPVLFGLSTFFWRNGEYGVIAATILASSMVFWIPALSTLFGLLKNKMPYYYSIGLFIAIYGCCMGGIGFGLLGYFSTIFNISHQTYLKTLSQYPISSGILLFWAGPLFPLSLLVLGINLTIKKAVENWLGIILCLGAILFPLSRILRIEIIAHVADLLLAIPFIVVGWRSLTGAIKINDTK
ncbi:hypothetical protein SNE25_17815 [Mucilaginibacter sabulilitoris]|uniref:Uncharacterized protein n=1 Tax=Mucilaginibacter sabulilitoris TaxID=1173583 RepID=A0ABZ0TFH3_9SPHI|nr:hypothetical protein [Mucilaginibacter sabulilitoris]WPU91177.1 hypothetical protein SNE25_17815 [Mucilaginibacter sabulilitoris]